MMKVVHSIGDGNPAKVFAARLNDGSLIEFVDSMQPPVPRSEKWVLIVSTLKGCPVKCPICDAGGDYGGKLTASEIANQIEYMIMRRYPDGRVPVPKLKIQFARMGDPAFNDAVLDVLETLPEKMDLPGLMPCISTIAPAGRRRFFDKLAAIKRELYQGGSFQMQFSLHTTDEEAKRTLVPFKTWSFREIAEYGELFFREGDRKIGLNFAPAAGLPLEPEKLALAFSPELFRIKLTPINPTFAATRSGLKSLIDPADRESSQRLVEQFKEAGYSDVILSIGDLAENEIGSNCGMYAMKYSRGCAEVEVNCSRM